MLQDCRGCISSNTERRCGWRGNSGTHCSQKTPPNFPNSSAHPQKCNGAGTKVFGHPLLGGVESRMTERARADSKTLKSPPSARGTKCFLPRSPSLLPSFYSRDIKWGRLMSDFGFFRRRRGKLNFRRWAGRGSSVDATHPPR